MPDRGAKSMLEQRPLLLLIDGPALVHRGWHAIREPLNVSRTGEEVRAVYGFMNTFLRYLDDWNPTHCAIRVRPQGADLQARPVHGVQGPQALDAAGAAPAVRPRAPAHGAVQRPHLRGAALRGGRRAGDAPAGWRRRTRSRRSCCRATRTSCSSSPRGCVCCLHTASRSRRRTTRRVCGSGTAAWDRRRCRDIKALEEIPPTTSPRPRHRGQDRHQAPARPWLCGGYPEQPGRGQAAADPGEPAAERAGGAAVEILATIVRDVPLEFDLEASRFWQYDRSGIVEALRDLEFFSMVPRIPEPHRRRRSRGAGGAVLPSGRGGRLPRRRHDGRAGGDGRGVGYAGRGSPSKCRRHRRTRWPRTWWALAFASSPGEGWYVPVGHAEGNGSLDSARCWRRSSLCWRTQPFRRWRTTPTRG